MKRLLLLAGLLACLALGSCQCSDQPSIGPVEGSSAAAVVPVSPVPLA